MSKAGYSTNIILRRVRSFTNRTEIDPPHGVMLAELERRRKPVVSNKEHGGRVVTVTGHHEKLTVLTAESAHTFQMGWRACGLNERYVWVVDEGGNIDGYQGNRLTLVD